MRIFAYIKNKLKQKKASRYWKGFPDIGQSAAQFGAEQVTEHTSREAFNGNTQATDYSKIKNDMNHDEISEYANDEKYMEKLFDTERGPKGSDLSEAVMVDTRTDIPYWVVIQHDGQKARYLKKEQLTFTDVKIYAGEVSEQTYAAVINISDKNWRGCKESIKEYQNREVITGIEQAAEYSTIEAITPGENSIYSSESDNLTTLFTTDRGPKGWGISEEVVVDSRTDTPYWIVTQYDGGIVAETWYLDKEKLTFEQVKEYARDVSPEVYAAVENITAQNWHECAARLKEIAKR